MKAPLQKQVNVMRTLLAVTSPSPRTFGDRKEGIEIVSSLWKRFGCSLI